MKKTLTILLVFFSVLGWGQGSPNLRAITDFIRFEGNANGEKGLSGSITGATLVTGKVGQCYDYTNSTSQYADLGSSIGEFGTSDFSVAFWVNATTTAANLSIIVGNRPDENAFDGGWLIDYRSNDAGITSFYTVYDDGGGSNVQQVNGTIDIADDAWHHVVCTRNSTTMVIYVDGDFDTSFTLTEAANNVNSGLNTRVSYETHASFDSMDGKLDELMIFPRALKEIEVGQLAKGSPNGLLYVYENYLNDGDYEKFDNYAKGYFALNK